VAVVFGGTVRVIVRPLPSSFHALVILPRIESYWPLAQVRPPPGRGRMRKCLGGEREEKGVGSYAVALFVVKCCERLWFFGI
jgi:hypothetical protein